jgi:hypothetical protein
MSPEAKQDLAIVLFSVFLGIIAALLLLAFTGCAHAPVSSVNTATLSGHLTKAQSHVSEAESYLDYSDGKAVIIRNLLK